jgi:hypothetical protein
MSAARRRKIDALRRLAASTTFPAERDAALAKADALEETEHAWADAELRAFFPTFAEAIAATGLNQALRERAIREAEETLGALKWGQGTWVIPGHGPLVGEDELMRMYSRRAA